MRKLELDKILATFSALPFVKKIICLPLSSLVTLMSIVHYLEKSGLDGHLFFKA